MEYLTILAVIAAIWAAAVIGGRMSEAAEMSRLSDEDLIMAMNVGGHYDNKYRREYARRHPNGALS